MITETRTQDNAALFLAKFLGFLSGSALYTTSVKTVTLLRPAVLCLCMPETELLSPKTPIIDYLSKGNSYIKIEQMRYRNVITSNSRIY